MSKTRLKSVAASSANPAAGKPALPLVQQILDLIALRGPVRGDWLGAEIGRDAAFVRASVDGHVRSGMVLTAKVTRGDGREVVEYRFAAAVPAADWRTVESLYLARLKTLRPAPKMVEAVAEAADPVAATAPQPRPVLPGSAPARPDPRLTPTAAALADPAKAIATKAKVAPADPRAKPGQAPKPATMVRRVDDQRCITWNGWRYDVSAIAGVEPGWLLSVWPAMDSSESLNAMPSGGSIQSAVVIHPIPDDRAAAPAPSAAAPAAAPIAHPTAAAAVGRPAGGGGKDGALPSPSENPGSARLDPPPGAGAQEAEDSPAAAVPAAAAGAPSQLPDISLDLAATDTAELKGVRIPLGDNPRPSLAATATAAAAANPAAAPGLIDMALRLGLWPTDDPQRIPTPADILGAIDALQAENGRLLEERRQRERAGRLVRATVAESDLDAPPVRYSLDSTGDLVIADDDAAIELPLPDVVRLCQFLADCGEWIQRLEAEALAAPRGTSERGRQSPALFAASMAD